MILATLLQLCASCTDADQIGVGLGVLMGAGADGAVAATGALGELLAGAVDPARSTRTPAADRPWTPRPPAARSTPGA